MSTSREHGAVLYVVSRSGKVLRSEDRSKGFVDGDYFEGELEGWIFWGSSRRRNMGSGGMKRRQDAVVAGSGGAGFIGKSFESLGRVSWTNRIPVVVWGDETDAIQDVFSPLSWRHNSPYGRKNTARMRNAEAWKDANVVFESSLAGCLRPHEVFRSELWYRTEQNYKIGLSQLAFLQKSDMGSKWEPGTRELAARWAAWLLKMLRKTRSRPLQHLLFTMCSAVLPVICCGLVREQWTRLPDQELRRIVDIIWRALEKSCAYFTRSQWELLEERLFECRMLRMRVGTLTNKNRQGAVLMESLEGELCMAGLQSKRKMLNPSGRTSQDAHQQCSYSRDEQLSNILVQREGVSALVKRALHEKLFTPQLRHVGGRGGQEGSGGSGTIVSLICPLSGRRVKVPARGRCCSHPSSFDLQSFLEEHAKPDPQRCSSVHQRKKPKTQTGGWCCPICGSDATWPQIGVDRVLLRILEVLPEHMPQVCLLPNGRWHVVWSPVHEDSEKVDSKLRTVTFHPPFKPACKGIGQCGELRHDAQRAIDHCFGQEEACAFHEVQILHRAYKAWKDEVDHHLANGSSAEQIELQWGADSTVAVWTGDHNSKDSLRGAPPQNLINLGETRSKVRAEFTNSINYTRAVSSPAVVEDVAKISESECRGSQRTQVDESETEIGSGSKLILEALQALGGITSVCDGAGSLYAGMRIGQHKSRPKVMAKKM